MDPWKITAQIILGDISWLNPSPPPQPLQLSSICISPGVSYSNNRDVKAMHWEGTTCQWNIAPGRSYLWVCFLFVWKGKRGRKKGTKMGNSRSENVSFIRGTDMLKSDLTVLFKHPPPSHFRYNKIKHARGKELNCFPAKVSYNTH